LEWWLALLLLFSGFILLLLIAMPVAFAFLLVNIVGVFCFWGGAIGLNQLVLSIDTSVSSFALLPVPMFILMGEVMFQSGVGFQMMDVLDKWMGRIPGRLALISVAAGTMFATLSGAAMGSVALLGSVLTPEMEKRGYKKPMSLGPVLGSGGLAIMIPPTALGVILATLGEFSVGRLLIAIVVPGLMMALSYAIYIILRCKLQPSLAPAYEVAPVPLSKKLVATLQYILPLGFIIFMVTGIIFLGVATPSEAAATGALSCFILAAAYRRLNWEVVKKSVNSAMRISVMIFLIIAAAKGFGQNLAFTGATKGLAEFTMGLPLAPIVIFITIQVIVVIMGMFMEPASIIMITLPVFMPVVHTLGFDPVWFAIVMLLNIQLGMLSPPFGMSLFVMKGVAPPDTTMGDIYRAALPFFALNLVGMALIIAFPALALWLPGLMR